MVRRLALLGLAGTTLCPVPGSAALVEGTATTMAIAGDVPVEGSLHTAVPISELVWVRAREFDHYGFDELGVEVQGWLEGDPADPPGTNSVGGDVDVAYIEGTLMDRRLSLRLGRQLVLGGAARNLQFDGIDGRVRAGKHFEGSVYWGRAVRPEFKFVWADYVAGARLFWRQFAGTELGVSFIRQQDDGQLARQDAGADLRYAPTDWISAFGSVVWATTQGRVSQIDGYADWHPTNQFQVLGGYKRTAPDLFLPIDSIMTVFSEESQDELGGTVYYQPFWMLRARASYHYLNLEEGNGSRAEIRGDLYLDEGYRTRLGVGVSALAIPTNQFLLPRLDATRRITHRLSISGNVESYVLRDAINSQSYSLTGLLAGNYQLTEHFQGTLAGYGGSTPFMQNQWQVMAKLSYGLQSGVFSVVQ